MTCGGRCSRASGSGTANAGLRLGVHQAIAVDRHTRTSAAGVLAAGDCVHTCHRLLQADTYLPLGTTAHKQDRVAGDNAVGGRRAIAGSLGTQVVRVFDQVAAATGLRDAQAAAAGFAPLTIEAVTDDHKAYYPGATWRRSPTWTCPAPHRSAAPGAPSSTPPAPGPPTATHPPAPTP